MKKLGKKFESTLLTVIGFKCKSKKQKCAVYCIAASCSCNGGGNALMNSNDVISYETRYNQGWSANP